MNQKEDGSVYFGGYSKPNYTMVPDELFDRQLPYLTGSQLKVLLYIIRRTFGFKKDTDSISLSQICTGIRTRDGQVLDRGTGLSRRHVVAATRALDEMGIIRCERRQSLDKGFESTVYSLNLSSELSDTLGTKGNQGASSQKSLGPGDKKELALVPKRNQQETVVQETVSQKTELHNSNIRKIESGGKRQGRAAADAQANPGPEGVGAILGRMGQGHTGAVPRGAGNGASDRPEAGEEDFQRIQHIILTSQREFGDRASAKSSTTRAWNLYQKAGYTIGRFEEALYQARSLTKEATAQITAEGEDPNYGLRRKIKMPYFFAVLEDVLGLRAAPQKPAPTAKTPRKAKGSSDRRYLPHIET